MDPPPPPLWLAVDLSPGASIRDVLSPAGLDHLWNADDAEVGADLHILQ